MGSFPRHTGSARGTDMGMLRFDLARSRRARDIRRGGKGMQRLRAGLRRAGESGRGGVVGILAGYSELGLVEEH